MVLCKAVLGVVDIVTTPAALTVATPVAEELQVNAWPDTVLPSDASALAVSVCVSPTETRVSAAGVTTSEETVFGGDCG